MVTPVRTPRVNNNDDSVRLTRMLVQSGDRVHTGDPIAEVVTDKATFVVEAESEGYVIRVCAAEDQLVDVGAALVLIGDTADERVPMDEAPGKRPAATAQPLRPTLKAQMLMDAYGIDAADLCAADARPSVGDVERYIAARGLAPRHGVAQAQIERPAARVDGPTVAGTLVPLTPEERGMLRTVSWHQDAPVPAYIEVPYDPEPWEHAAAAFQRAHQLLFNPLLSLMAWKLARIAAERRTLNAAITEGQRHVYAHVNVGFTVHAESTLYLVVVKDADRLPALAFCDRLTTLQRRAAMASLEASEVSGATISFSSMARWKVSRHVPVLPPHSSVIVAHTAPSRGEATFGATYDHRAASGADIVALLEALGHPPDAEALTWTPVPAAATVS